MTSIYDFGVGGFDLVFTMPDLSSGQWVEVKANIAVCEEDAEDPASAVSYIRIGNDSEYYVTLYDSGYRVMTTSYAPHIETGGVVRIIFHNEFCTVYVDSLWLYTFSFDAVYYPEEPVVSMRASTNITVTGIRLKELSDWREAIFIDMETTSQNAIGSVVLQRPVDIRQNYLGQMVFEYDPVRSSREIKFIKEHAPEEYEPSNACSDAIVYFTNAAVVIDREFAKTHGFVTRMYRLPDLDNGAIRATRIMQKRARQSAFHHSVIMRYNPIYEVGDIAGAVYTASSTGYDEDADIIIEQMQISFANGEAKLVISGRENIP